MTTLGPKATWGTLHNQVRYFVSDAPGASDTWDDTQVVDAINFAINEYCKRTNVTYVEKGVPIAAGGVVTLAPGTGGTNVNYLTLVRVNYAGLDLDKTTAKAESLRDPGWEVATAAVGETTKKWVQYNGNTIRLLKIQSTWNGGTNCTIGFIEQPTELAADADTVDARIPTHHHRHLKYAAAAFLYAIDGDNQDMAKAERLMLEFEALIKFSPSGGA